MTEWIRTKKICEAYAIGNRNLVSVLEDYNHLSRVNKIYICHIMTQSELEMNPHSTRK